MDYHLVNFTLVVLESLFVTIAEDYIKKTKAKVNKGNEKYITDILQVNLCCLDPVEDTINLEDATKKHDKQGCPC